MATAETISSAPPTPLRLLPPAPDLHARFSREAYHLMFELGVLDRESHVELIDGEIFMMSPMGPTQGGLITRLANYFIRSLPESLDCRVQMPLVAGDHSEPEPDIAIVKRRDDDYTKEHPAPNEVLLVVEVSQTSLSFDKGPKSRLYASSGIPEYWVIDIPLKSIHVYRTPAGSNYTDATTLVGSNAIAPVSAPNCQIDVDWLFH